MGGKNIIKREKKLLEILKIVLLTLSKMTKIKNKPFFIFVFLVLLVFLLCGFSPIPDYYHIFNDTDMDIVYDLQNKDIAIYSKIDYFDDGVFIDRITVLLAGTSGSYTILPGKRAHVVAFDHFSYHAHIGVMEKFLLVVENLVIYDSDGHTIMTMEDITANTFSVEDYGRGFVIHITPEVIETGRRKYK
jgi:hypothetical protein